MTRLSLILLAAVLASDAGKASSAPRTERAFAPAKTPWGDPDLQGNYTNKYEYGTPFERPQEFEGRRLEDVTAKELADAVKKRQEDALERAKFLGGDPEGKIGNSAEFRDIYEVSQGSRAWLVADPPDGKIPPVKPGARARVAQRGGSSFGNGPFNGPEDFSLWERCITRGFPESMIPGVYEQYECHEGNQGVSNILSAARAVERRTDAALLAAKGFAAQESRQSWNGQVTDTVCLKHPTPATTGTRGVAARKQCTLTCVKNNADFALLIDAKLYAISNAKDVVALLQKYAGEDIKITGVMNGTTITVTRIEAPL